MRVGGPGDGAIGGELRSGSLWLDTRNCCGVVRSSRRAFPTPERMIAGAGEIGGGVDGSVICVRFGVCGTKEVDFLTVNKGAYPERTGRR